MADTRTITGTLYEADGTTVADGSTVRFKLIRGAWSATEHAIPSEVSDETSSGAFSVTVYTPAEYKVYLPNGYQFNLTVPEGASVDLESLRLAQEDLPNLTSILDDWLDALALTALADGPGAYDNGKYLQSTADGWAWAAVAGGVSDIGDLTATGYGSGQSPRWDGAAWTQADYYTEAEVDALIAPFATSAALTAHTGDTNNPHSVTAAQVGALTQAAGDARYGQLGAANTWAIAQTFTGQVFGKDGNTPGTPSFAFTSDPNTGMYSSGADVLALAAGGTLAMSMTATAVTSPLTFNQNGTFNANSFFNLTLSDAATNSASAVGTLRHNTSGAAANGFGLRWDWQLETSTGAVGGAGNEAVYWVDATHASRSSGFRVSLVYNAANYDAFQVSRTGAADSTGLWLYDETAGSLKQVTRGAADSGGAGFRLLRVAN